VKPSSRNEKSFRWNHALVAMILLGNLALIVAWPWLEEDARLGARRLYAGLCHQLPSRSYQVRGEPLPVCTRCLGVWLGLAAMASAMGLGMRWRWQLGVSLLGWMVLSWVVGAWLPTSWHLERTLAGVAGGAGIYAVLERGSRGLGRLFRGGSRLLLRSRRHADGITQDLRT
jgi:hypothetical protein